MILVGDGQGTPSEGTNLAEVVKGLDSPKTLAFPNLGNTGRDPLTSHLQVNALVDKIHERLGVRKPTLPGSGRASGTHGCGPVSCGSRR